MLLLGIATGGLLPVWNALVPRLFGVANFGRTMGLMGPVISLTTMSVYPLVGSVRDATGSYAAVFQGDLVALAVAVAIVIPLREGPRLGPQLSRSRVRSSRARALPSITHYSIRRRPECPMISSSGTVV